MLGLAVVGVMALLIAGTVVPNAEAAQPVTAQFAYKNSDEFWDKLTKEYENYKDGLSRYSTDSEINEIISKYNYFVFNSSEGSLYLFGCFLPNQPPLNVGQSVLCLVFFFAGPGETITINDLRVYVDAPIHIPITAWNWAPGTIPNPFIWLSGPITLNQAGQWIIVADFTENEQVVISLDVTFQVVPESIIGVAGVVAGPLAVLAYKLRKKSNAQ